jgi:16S rRNA processing protein RimM
MMAGPSFSTLKGTGDGVVIMGRVTGLFGVNGWVKVYSYTRERSDILHYTPWLVRLPSQSQVWKEQAVAEGRVQGAGIIARLEDYNDRDQASALVGADIAVHRAQLPALAEGEFYWAQLEGLRVVTLTGVDLGRVSHLLETGANDVLVVRSESAESPEKVGGNPPNEQERIHQTRRKEAERERWIPYIRGVIKEVDLGSGIIRVDWDADF